MNAPGPEIYTTLAARIGQEQLARRVALQVEYAGAVYAGACGGLHLEHAEPFAALVRSVLVLGGMWSRCTLQALQMEVVHVTAIIPGLPAGWHGARILHLSDLHLDGFQDGGVALRRALDGLHFDGCVITGDFRFLTLGPHDEALRRLAGMMPQLRCPLGVLAVLGNHDFIEFVPELEAMGVRVLLNEAVRLQRHGTPLLFAGVDDPHFYRCADMDRALIDMKPGEPVLLLAHTPELYAEAAAAGVAYYLCGHTHGGQICLPGRHPVLTNARCPRRMVSGPWQQGKMQGYTSRGCGSSGVPARLFCPPEITVHTLRSAHAV